MANEKSSAEEFIQVAGSKNVTVVRTSFDLEEDGFNDFKALCRYHNVSMTDVLDRIIVDFVKKFPDDIVKARKEYKKTA